MNGRIVGVEEARSLGPDGRWALLSPYLTRHGGNCMGYSTLQEGMEYFILDGVGYISFHTIKHSLFARGGLRFVLGDPAAPLESFAKIAEEFVKACGSSVFYQIGRPFAEILHKNFGYRMNEVGVEWDLDVQKYDLKGKDKAKLRQWVNKARKEGVEVFESSVDAMDLAEVKRISDDWLARKGGSEARVVTRPMSFAVEPGVRYFWAKRDGKLLGFTGFDPLYKDGKAVGFYHDHVRLLDEAPHGSSDLMLSCALEKFKAEGLQVVSLGLSPLCLPTDSDLHYRRTLSCIMRFMYKHCNFIYPFQGNFFHKSHYCGSMRRMYIGNTGGFLVPDLIATLLDVC